MQEALIPNAQLPEIPNKRYFTIGEVSHLCSVKAHVLRYWEQEFPTLKPMKRRGNRRYYQRSDVLMIRRIRALLYEQGYTISGARQQLLESAVPAQPLISIVEKLASIEVVKVSQTPKVLRPFPDGLDLEQLIRQLEAAVKVLRP
ncbi:MerR family transcriptional regulator [Thiofilum flexile]|uniref:MerR family transcriptional regulator n=1 Tax=Thiofilum flexile TaxID=125627 RepID=UPI00036504AC